MIIWRKYCYLQQMQQITLGINFYSAGTSQDIEDNRNNEYRASIYYSGWQSLTGELENTWTKMEKNMRQN